MRPIKKETKVSVKKLNEAMSPPQLFVNTLESRNESSYLSDKNIIFKSIGVGRDQ